MWGKENSSNGILQRITVCLVSGFVILQFVVFVRDAFKYRCPEDVSPTVIHDTVYITEKIPISSASGNSSGSSRARARASDSPASEDVTPSPQGERQEPVRGDSDWKWDVVELNSADSAALDDLPGIGGYYAKQILRLRERLGAFTEVGQLLEIRGIDSARVARLATRVRIDSSAIVWLDLNTVPEEVLAQHPYVGKVAARGIVRLRETLPEGEFSLESIVSNGILTEGAALRLGRYVEK